MAGKGSPKGVKQGGRKKGVPNKITTDLKTMILTALEEVGGKEYLKIQAFANPNAFVGLVGKILPKDINATVEGKMAVSLINDFE